jgi:hypothetical protein
MTAKDLLQCSRAGCLAPATNKILWRNPKIHSLDRTKTWLACEDHLEFLVDYLDTRGFYIGSEKTQ